MIVAVDFDGTLFMTGRIGSTVPALPCNPVIALCKRLRSEGHRIILWTCRMPGQGLEEAVLLCLDQGLEFDAVNENLPETLEKWGDCRKILADVYIDNRGCHPLHILEEPEHIYSLLTPK